MSSSSSDTESADSRRRSRLPSLPQYFVLDGPQKVLRGFIEARQGRRLSAAVTLECPVFVKEPWCWFLLGVGKDLKREELTKANKTDGSVAEEFAKLALKVFVPRGRKV